MPNRRTLLSLSILGYLGSVVCTSVEHQARSFSYLEVCKEISSSVSNASEVFYPLSISYTSDVYHWASSSSQSSACSVEPGTAEDVGVILQIVGNNSTPFAVKGGGHSANPGFSSTDGVHIAMSRFKDVVYDQTNGVAEVGSGLVWDDVYDALEPYGVNVVGGRVPGVGVAGFTLGGGYSWLTNQHGLTIDTVTAYELVLPNGTVTTVTTDDGDLFFALKGGFNNYGIVTKFTLKTFSQGQVWGGLMTFTGDKFDALANATANFGAVTDPKAAIITEFNTIAGLPGVTMQLFYDDPEQPEGIFDEFLAIDHFSKDVETRSFSSLIQATPSDATSGQRGAFHTVSVANFTRDVIDVILSEVTRVGSDLGTLLSTGTFISYDVEPFLPTLFDHATSDSAYPPSRSAPFLPLNLYYSWIVSAADTSFRNVIKESAARIESAVAALGQDISDAGLYGNYALDGTSLESIYGSDHVARMSAVKSQVDPQNIMSLAGGWKVSPA